MESVLYLPVEAVHSEELCRISCFERQVRDQENLFSSCLVGTKIGPRTRNTCYLLDIRNIENRGTGIDT